MFISKEKEGALVSAILGATGGILISHTALIGLSVVGAVYVVRVSSMEETSTNNSDFLKLRLFGNSRGIAQKTGNTTGFDREPPVLTN